MKFDSDRGNSALILNPNPPAAFTRAAAIASRGGSRLIGFALLGLVVAFVLIALRGPSGAVGGDDELDTEDHALLQQTEQRAVRFFMEHSDPRTGLTQDRAPANGATSNAPASVAATGFALSGWCIAEARGWLAPGEARNRVLATVRFAAHDLAQEHGWFYHFVDPRNGQRAGLSEVSTIDTALFLQGAVFAREYFHDPAITAEVNAIYRRIDWHWAQDGRLSLSMGWRPENGFIPARWDGYCELMGLYLLGIGAPRQPLPPAAWDVWSRATRATYDGHTFIQCGPLFTHQYSHAWFDFRDRQDAYADYWQNSVDATLAQRAWSAAQAKRYPRWSRDLWGLTASDGPHGYMTWGTPGPGPDLSDGTLVPCAPAGSLPFAPHECLTALEQMRQAGGAALWGRYGFADSFNPQTGWVDPDVLGIDVGITLVMAENLRSGLVWRHFMQAPEVQRGMSLAGFVRKPAAPPAIVASSIKPVSDRPHHG
jgi:hypothetical protein